MIQIKNCSFGINQLLFTPLNIIFWIFIFTPLNIIFEFLFFISESVENAFTDPAGEFDYVINLAAETKYGQTKPVCYL